jgi:Family of unknown function (DUF6011)
MWAAAKQLYDALTEGVPPEKAGHPALSAVALLSGYDCADGDKPLPHTMADLVVGVRRHVAQRPRSLPVQPMGFFLRRDANIFVSAHQKGRRWVAVAGGTFKNKGAKAADPVAASREFRNREEGNEWFDVRDAFAAAGPAAGLLARAVVLLFFSDFVSAWAGCARAPADRAHARLTKEDVRSMRAAAGDAGGGGDDDSTGTMRAAAQASVDKLLRGALTPAIAALRERHCPAVATSAAGAPVGELLPLVEGFYEVRQELNKRLDEARERNPHVRDLDMTEQLAFGCNGCDCKITYGYVQGIVVRHVPPGVRSNDEERVTQLVRVDFQDGTAQVFVPAIAEAATDCALRHLSQLQEARNEDWRQLLKKIGALTRNCLICGRTLKSESSVAAGIGPECMRRIAEDFAEDDAAQDLVVPDDHEEADAEADGVDEETEADVDEESEEETEAGSEEVEYADSNDDDEEEEEEEEDSDEEDSEGAQEEAENGAQQVAENGAQQVAEAEAEDGGAPPGAALAPGTDLKRPLVLDVAEEARKRRRRAVLAAPKRIAKSIVKRLRSEQDTVDGPLKALCDMFELGDGDTSDDDDTSDDEDEDESGSSAALLAQLARLPGLPGDVTADEMLRACQDLLLLRDGLVPAYHYYGGGEAAGGSGIDERRLLVAGRLAVHVSWDMFGQIQKWAGWHAVTLWYLSV